MDFGKFFGTDCVCLQQAHKVNSTEFMLDDKTVYVMASDDRPIKYVTAGDGMIIQHDPTMNADLTYDWMYAERSGVALAIGKKFGKYTFAK